VEVEHLAPCCSRTVLLWRVSLIAGRGRSLLGARRDPARFVSASVNAWYAVEINVSWLAFVEPGADDDPVLQPARTVSGEPHYSVDLHLVDTVTESAAHESPDTARGSIPCTVRVPSSSTVPGTVTRPPSASKVMVGRSRRRRSRRPQVGVRFLFPVSTMRVDDQHPADVTVGGHVPLPSSPGTSLRRNTQNALVWNSTESRHHRVPTRRRIHRVDGLLLGMYGCARWSRLLLGP